MNKALSIAKLNFRHMKTVYFITLIVMIMMSVDYILNFAMPTIEDDVTLSAGCVMMLLPALSGILVPAKYMRYTLNLGAKRQDVFAGTAGVYIITSAAATLLMVLIRYTLDALLKSGNIPVIDILDVFGFINNGPAIAYLQIFSLMLFIAAFAHTLTAMQDKWYGWAADVVIVAIISVFIPILPLRQVLISFFNLIIFNENAVMQIIVCLALATVIYALSRPILARKVI